jgi:RimJ/RimL family protein N-acetyltransferase
MSEIREAAGEMQLISQTLEGRVVRLEPFSEALREAVRLAMNCDPDTWSIMGASAAGEHFDAWWSAAETETAEGVRIPFAVRRLSDGAVVGTTSLMNIRSANRGVEIGWTFYRPDARGGPVNPECKRLLMAHAFEGGAVRVEFMVDVRNLRSQAAVAKLGAVREGVMRHHKITWTGHIRDTVVFSVTDKEWPAVRDGLDARLATFAAP